MSKRNRKDTVEQEKKQPEEITELQKEPEDNIGSEEDLPLPEQDEQTIPDTDSRLKIIEGNLAEVNDKYLRLSAEFDNYRKRTMREKAELIKSAGEDILSNILPVVDNFERAIAAIKETSDPEAIREGVLLIYSKFKDFLTQRGIKEIDTLNKPFDTELHDAITKIPVDTKEQQGIVVDVVEKGYYLNDKIIRHSKVVVGEYNEPGTSGAVS